MPRESDGALEQSLGYANIVGAASATATNVNVNNTMAYRRGKATWTLRATALSLPLTATLPTARW